MATDLYVIIVPDPRDPLVPDVIGPFTADDVDDAQDELRKVGLSSANDPPVITVQLTSLRQVLAARARDKKPLTFVEVTDATLQKLLDHGIADVVCLKLEGPVTSGQALDAKGYPSGRTVACKVASIAGGSTLELHRVR